MNHPVFILMARRVDRRRILLYPGNYDSALPFIIAQFRQLQDWTPPRLVGP